MIKHIFIWRRWIFALPVSLTLVFMLLGFPSLKAANAPIPVILDSDIGDDIDDTWALGLLLKSPELDLKLVVGDQGKPAYRARLIAKFLEKSGRTDVAVGLGLDVNAHGDGPQAEWVKDYDLKAYPGKVYTNGVQAIIDTIMHSPQTMTIIAIGPVPNLAAALEREPAIARHARLVGMYGSVRLGYGGNKEVSPEYNVKADIKACQRVFTAPWDITITPLDTCGLIDLTGEHYQKVRNSLHPVAAAVIQNYRLWQIAQDKGVDHKTADVRSSTLFDTVAVYLAISQDLVQMESLGIRVDDQGFTRIDPQAKVVKVATAWKDLPGFKDFLVNRLTGFMRRLPQP